MSRNEKTTRSSSLSLGLGRIRISSTVTQPNGFLLTFSSLKSLSSFVLSSINAFSLVFRTKTSALWTISRRSISFGKLNSTIVSFTDKFVSQYNTLGPSSLPRRTNAFLARTDMS